MAIPCINYLMSSPRKSKSASISSAAIAADALEQSFPALKLPIQPPYLPAEAKSSRELPREPGWLYEPKWDGFRCLAFGSGNQIALQSKAGQTLGRYFPEIVDALRGLPVSKFVLDGEIVIRRRTGLDFDALLQRIHPAASRIQRLSQETPATYMVFDLLVDAQGRAMTARPLAARRMALQEFAVQYLGASAAGKGRKAATPKTAKSARLARSRVVQRIILSPASSDFATAERWMREGAASGWDGVIAKRLNCEYTSGERTGMIKIKRIRTADCVVAGLRWARGSAAKRADATSAGRPTKEVGSLLLGLYNAHGRLDHVGFSSSFTREERKKLKSILKPFLVKHGHEAGFTGKAPGGPSRWTRDDRDTEWVPLSPRLVGEFQYDHFSGGRFRHGTKLLRWRPEKKPRQCTMEQLVVRTQKRPKTAASN